MQKKPDLLIVMGTSLKIPGIKKIIKETAQRVHGNTRRGICIYIDKTKLPPKSEWVGIFDYHLLGDSDRAIELLGIDVPVEVLPAKQKRPISEEEEDENITAAHKRQKTVETKPKKMIQTRLSFPRTCK